MKREMAGKITSAVSGLSENTEAVAKELNATITFAQSMEWKVVRDQAHTRKTAPEAHVHR